MFSPKPNILRRLQLAAPQQRSLSLPFHKPWQPNQRKLLSRAIFARAEFAGEGAAEYSPHTITPTTQSSRRHPATAFPRIGLDASFVNINIPYSHYPPSGVDGNIRDILDGALRSSCEAASSHNNASRSEIINGADMHEASRRMDIFLESAMSILSGGSNGMEGEASHRKYFCPSCLER